MISEKRREIFNQGGQGEGKGGESRKGGVMVYAMRVRERGWGVLEEKELLK